MTPAEFSRYLEPLVRAQNEDDVEKHTDFLGTLGPEAEHAVSVLIDGLHDDDPNTRVFAIFALYWVGRAAEDAGPALIDALRDEDPRVRAVAVEALTRFGPAEDVVPALISALQDGDPGVCAAAVEALTWFGPTEDIVSALIAALKHADSFVREVAAYSLGTIGPAAEAAVPALVIALQDENRRVCVEAAKALDMIGAKVEAKFSALIAALRDADIGYQAIEGENDGGEGENSRVNVFKFEKYKRFFPFGSRKSGLHSATSGGLPRLKDNQQAWNALVKELVVANHQHRQSLAARLNDALNAKIQKMEQGTLEDKKKICELVNNTLEPLGLAVQCPNTKLPAKLKATSGSYIGVGRFYFEVYIDGKQKKSTYSDTIPALQLMDAYPPKKLSTHFQDMVGPKASRGGRQLA